MDLRQVKCTTRRRLLASGAAMAAFGSMVPLARAKSPRALRLGIGLTAMSPLTINLVIGQILGYNREEGFTLKPLTLGTNANVQVALDRQDIDIGIGVPSFFVPMLAKGQWKADVNFYEYTYPYKWDVAVLPGSAIKSYRDLKGKRVGVSGFGSTEYPVTKAVLRRLGIDSKDVRWIAVGEGVAAGVALKRRAIDALAYYDVGFGQIEEAGIKLDFLARPADLPMVGGQFLMARRALLAKDRQLAVGFGRSVCKASQFILANPDAGARAFLKMYPAAAPRGSSTAQAVAVIRQEIGRRIRLYKPPYTGAKMGSINPAEFTAEAKLDGVKVTNIEPLYTNELIDEINNFDAKAIAAQAATYPT